MRLSYRTSGFTLVELSIVLVVIGLIIGGVLVGRDLIRSAQTRTVIKEVEGYTTAIYAFKSKYGEYPGDYRGAYAIWGATAGCTNQWVYNSSAGCNGNGDAVIGAVAGSGSGPIDEENRASQHLALAGMIAGDYSGGGGLGSVFGMNTPASKFPGGGYSITNGGGVSISSSTPSLLFGAQRSGNRPVNKVTSGMDGYAIDTKIDDGKAYTGKVNAVTAYDTIAPENCESGGSYDRTNGYTACRMSFAW